jgi:hypothetical protein
MAISKTMQLEKEADEFHEMLVPVLGVFPRPHISELRFDSMQPPGQFFSQIVGGVLDQRFDLARIGRGSIGPASDLLYRFGVRDWLADAINDCVCQINSPIVENRTSEALVGTLRSIIFYENEEQIREAFKKILTDSEDTYGHRRFPELLSFFFEESYAVEYPKSNAARFPRTMVFMVLLAEFEMFGRAKLPSELVRDFVDRFVADPFKVIKTGLEDYIAIRESEIARASKEAASLAR